MSTSFGAEGPGGAQRLFVPFLRPFVKSPTKGAATSVYLASAPDLARLTACYFVDSKPKRSSKRTYDESTTR